MDTEDLKILNLILDRLITNCANDISAFRTTYNYDYNEWDNDEWDNDNRYHAHNKHMAISWRPKVNSWKAKTYEQDNHVELHYYTADQTVSIQIDRRLHGNRSIKLGGGSNNKEIKIKFVQLYHKIKEWQAVEIPRKEREKFINATTEVFPDIIDHLILEDNDDKKS